MCADHGASTNGTHQAPSVVDGVTPSNIPLALRPEPEGGLPSYKQLPFRKGDPARSCWAWGEGDELGTLNLLTPERVKRAVQEIQTGERISLNWGLNFPDPPHIGRQQTVHKFYQKKPRLVYDDVLEFNTQASTQWDGLFHYGWKDAETGREVFYNGASTADIDARKIEGMSAWNRAGGIVGRGVLLDVYDWCQDNGEAYDPKSGFVITVELLEKVAKAQQVEFLKGDILFVRSGYTVGQYSMTAEERQQYNKHSPCPGVDNTPEGSEAMLEWLWDHHFAAHAGDTLAFERFIVPAPPGTKPLHETLLSCFGCPIGELFDLEQLSVRCKELNKWTFFLTSSPLNVRNGIASPPNALAIL